MSNDTVTTVEAARLLRVSRQTIARWVKEGRLEPCARTAGGHLRFDREYILEMARRFYSG